MSAFDQGVVDAMEKLALDKKAGAANLIFGGGWKALANMGGRRAVAPVARAGVPRNRTIRDRIQGLIPSFRSGQTPTQRSVSAVTVPPTAPIPAVSPTTPMAPAVAAAPIPAPTLAQQFGPAIPQSANVPHRQWSQRAAVAQAASAMKMDPTQINNLVQKGGLTGEHYRALKETGMDPAQLRNLAIINKRNALAAARQEALLARQAAFGGVQPGAMRNLWKSTRRYGTGAAIAIPTIGIGSAAFGAGSAQAMPVDPGLTYQPGY